MINAGIDAVNDRFKKLGHLIQEAAGQIEVDHPVSALNIRHQYEVLRCFIYLDNVI